MSRRKHDVEIGLRRIEYQQRRRNRRRWIRTFIHRICSSIHAALAYILAGSRHAVEKFDAALELLERASKIDPSVKRLYMQPLRREIKKRRLEES